MHLRQCWEELTCCPPNAYQPAAISAEKGQPCTFSKDPYAAWVR